MTSSKELTIVYGVLFIAYVARKVSFFHHQKLNTLNNRGPRRRTQKMFLFKLYSEFILALCIDVLNNYVQILSIIQYADYPS